VTFLEQWSEDLRLACRGLLRARAFTGAAVLTLALGIAGSTVMFTLVQGVLLRPLPVRDQERLLVAWKESRARGLVHWPFHRSEIDAFGAESRLLERVAGVNHNGAPPTVVVEDGAASYVNLAAVTGTFFDVLGVSAVLGRALEASDDVAGAENVVVISRELWQRRYGGSPDAIGRRLLVNQQPYRIVGVMPADLGYPSGVEAWMTIEGLAARVTNPAFREGALSYLDLIARLRPGATLAQARSEMQGLVEALPVQPSASQGGAFTAVARSYADVVVGDVRRPMTVLFAAVALVLLIASANVANLLLLRGEARRAELALRAALGATRGRLARQLFAESLVLAVAAGLVAVLATAWAVRAVVALVPDGLPRVEAVRLDAPVLVFTFLVALLAAAVAGSAPALWSARTDLVSDLRSRGQAGTGTGLRHGRRALVVAQVALAVTIVAAAGLLVRSLAKLETVEMGLAADRLVIAELELPSAKYADPARRLRFLDDVIARLESAPGVDGATPINTPPFAGAAGWDASSFTIEGQDPERARTNPSLNLEAIHPSYFATFEVTFVRGRTFEPADRSGAPEVAIVSADLAEHAWPGQDPIGKRLKFGGADSKDPWRTVVGVVRPTRYRELAVPRATLYLPAEQFMVSAYILAVRTTSPPGLVAELAREHVRAVDPDVQVTRVAPFTQLLETPLARPRFNAFLIGLFGFTALLLAAIGLYAVMGAHVRERYAEIGIRVALGATSSDVGRLVLGEGLRLAALGAALGLAGAAVGTRLLRSLLFDVHPLDPASMLGAALLLVGASALAAYLPARRAARVDPLSVLRTS
jgi:putative ABC transport system permease protein